jgi:dihydrofolate synthase/folylpolyglutamate synthase
MDYAGTIDYILSLQKQGIKLGLEKMHHMMQLFGNPERTFRCIHVAGTNGKGSVSAMCAAMLRESGYSVGLYTSPHLVSFTERIRVDDQHIAELDVVRLAAYVREILAANPAAPTPTFFEFATLLAFLYFRERQIDWAVIETGMGGRLDATNVVQPEVSVLTRIGIDHQAYLGETIVDIAREKAGIMKHGVPVVSAAQEPDVREVLGACANDQGSSIEFYGDGYSASITQSSWAGLTIDYRNGVMQIDDIAVPLAGRYQSENAALAIHAVGLAFARLRSAKGEGDCALQADAVRHGLAKVRWPGRLEVVDTDPLTVIDGAHNPAAAEVLAACITELAPDYDIALVLGILADKNIPGIMSPLLSCAQELFLAEPGSSRAALVDTLAAFARSAGFQPHLVKDVREAVNAARDWCVERQRATGKKVMVLITGSLYTAGEACEAFGVPPIMGCLREHR